MAIRCSCSDHRHFRAASTQRSKGKSRQAEQLRKSGDAVAQLHREVMRSLSLEVFQSCGDVALRDTVGMVRRAGVGLGDLRGLFQPSSGCFLNGL